MRSRAIRLTWSVVAIVALGGAAFLVRQIQQEMTARRTAIREFDLSAHDAATAIGAARGAQRAYVAPGQRSSVWMPQVKALATQTASSIERLQTIAVTPGGRQALLDATAAVTDFMSMDQRARDYLSADQTLMASDMIFSDGGDTVADVERQIETARIAELVGMDAEEGRLREMQAYVAGGGVLFAALVLLLVAAGGNPRDSTSAPLAASLVHTDDSLPLKPIAVPEPPPSTPLAEDTPALDALGAVADVCTAFGRVQDISGLKRVLAQAAEALDASGLVVWLGSANGADLRPVVAHGYSDQVLALMRPVAKQADNAAAAAYRSAKLQIVPAKPGTSLGAIVAPILSADGCVGALTAEIKDNGEVSEMLHAMAVIFASQLAGILGPAAQPANASRAASA